MSARVLVYDIECSPIVAYTWDLKPYRLPIDNIVEHPRLLCVGAQWLGDKRVQLFSEWQHGRQGMLENMHRLLSEADVVAGYNSRGFDTPWVLAELAREGFTPPAPFAQVDLYREARQFRLPSHKLQYVSTQLFRLSGKLSTGGFGLWKSVLDGDPKAQAKMARYCKGDVKLTAELYEKMLPWMKKAPNWALYSDDPDQFGCPKCGAADLEKRGFAYTPLGKFQQFACKACGGWSRGKKAVATADVRGVSA